jgi:propanol-preferring alcohol dehydrogenase
MVLESLGAIRPDSQPLRRVELPNPVAGPNEIVLRVEACGVCHTELDEIEGRTAPPRLPIVLGHQVVGVVESRGEGAHRFKLGERVGVAWIFSACGDCRFCREGNENLCPSFRATGRDAPGGYAERMKVLEAFAFPISDVFTPARAAPLFCAGAIGYRSLRLSALREGGLMGLTGFGASAHLVLQLVRHLHPGIQVHVFARQEVQRRFALELGAVWAGDTAETPPEPLDAIIDTTPAWTPVVEGLRNLAPGGRLVINAIRKEAGDVDALQRLDYPIHLWMEKEIKSVANVSRRDVAEFLDHAAVYGIRPEVQEYPFADANRALAELKSGAGRGAKVLVH